MKIFECNDELERVLINFGFSDFTKPFDRAKGKRVFKLSRSDVKEIRFNYINFEFLSGKNCVDRIVKPKMPAGDLRMIFWYLKSNYYDRKIISQDYFTLQACRNSYQWLKDELDFCKEIGIANRRTKKLQRILNTHNNIILAG